jgi:hypothetical protein
VQPNRLSGRPLGELRHRRLNRHDGFALLFEHVPAPSVIAPCAAATGYENMMSTRTTARCDAMKPEEALRNILKLVEGSDEVEDAHHCAIAFPVQALVPFTSDEGLARFARAVGKIDFPALVLYQGTSIVINSWPGNSDAEIDAGLYGYCRQTESK